jgi:hypothetical protein
MGGLPFWEASSGEGRGINGRSTVNSDPGVQALNAAIDLIQRIGTSNIQQHVTAPR